jgi:ElaB/YqjD/DUF883 family membrane-anchored ribosome-binding protein
MTDSKTPQDKLQTLGAGISGVVNDALNDARPAVDRIADRISDQLNELSQQSRDAASQAQHAVEKRALHAQRAAERLIHQAPIRSVLIAAGTGAATALAVSWLMHLRKN